MHRGEAPAGVGAPRLEAIALAELRRRAGHGERHDEVRVDGGAVPVEFHDAVRDHVLGGVLVVIAACLRDKRVSAARDAARRLGRRVGGEEAWRLVPASLVEPAAEPIDELDDLGPIDECAEFV